MENQYKVSDFLKRQRGKFMLDILLSNSDNNNNNNDNNNNNNNNSKHSHVSLKISV